MCGIFGFVLTKPLPMTSVFKVLQKLEISQNPDEPTPLGGYGAGVAILLDNGDLFSEKVGRISYSPAADLAHTMKDKIAEASVLIGHVRMPSPEFMETAEFKESAQPFLGQFELTTTIASVHNGKIENYKELRKRLGKHVFESEKYELIDSEIIPHYFGELLNETDTVDEALYGLFCDLKGSSAIAMLHVGEENEFLHIMHKGKTRGLTVWVNDKDETIFCTRKHPLEEELGRTLASCRFREKVSIQHKENVGFTLSRQLNIS